MSFSVVGSRDTLVSDTSVFRVLWFAAVCHLCFSLPPQVSWSPVYSRLEFPTIDGDRKPVVWALNQFPFCSSKARFWPFWRWKLMETLHTEMQLIGILILGSMAFANPAVPAGDVVAPECVPCFRPQQICSSDAFSSVSVNCVSLAKYKLFNRNETCCHRSQQFEVVAVSVEDDYKCSL